MCGPPAHFPCSPPESCLGGSSLVWCLCGAVCVSDCWLVKNGDPSPPLSLGRTQESLLTCDIDATHRRKAERVLMLPGKSWSLHLGCGGLGSSKGRDTAWSHRATGCLCSGVVLRIWLDQVWRVSLSQVGRQWPCSLSTASLFPG